MDHRQHHLELRDGLDSVGLPGGHYDHLARCEGVIRARDADESLSLKNLQDGVIGSGVLREAFVCIEGKDRYGACRGVYEHPADDRAWLIGDQAAGVDDAFGKSLGFSLRHKSRFILQALLLCGMEWGAGRIKPHLFPVYTLNNKRPFVYYHLILTDACNLCCTYCRGKAFVVDSPDQPGITIDEDLPVDLDIDLDDLYRFLAKDPDPVLILYGGEPLLAPDLVSEIARKAPVSALILHTNGTLLDGLEPAIANRFDTILVSIDGPESLTDAHRGEGTFDRVMRNLRGLVAGGFGGELIARMTVAEDTDIVEAVRYLTENERFSFPAVHWQMDANFWNDYGMRDYAAWVSESYNPGIRSLVAFWVEMMRREARVLRWYPFIDPMEDMLLGRPGKLRCGCGHANYSIMTDGHIAPCPIMVGMKDYYAGHIATADPLHLPVTAVGSPCTECGILEFCGGRCLYSNILRPWPEEGRRIVCSTVENLRAALSAALPHVRSLIRDGRIRMEDFSHRRYNSCEIIP